MNYLAHIFYSNEDIDLMINNLFGDFVKGKNIDKYNLEIKSGIELHRKLDDFIDTHETTKTIKLTISKYLPKVYPIAIDLYYDHFLAKNWSNYHNENLNTFLNNFFDNLVLNPDNYSVEFNDFILKMKDKKWLIYYNSLFGLYKLSQGVSKMLNFNNELYKAHFVYLKFKNIIDYEFSKFTESAINEFITKKS